MRKGEVMNSPFGSNHHAHADHERMAGAGVAMAPSIALERRAEDIFLVECISHWHADNSRCDHYPFVDSDGDILCGLSHSDRVEWVDVVENLVVNAGLNHLMSRLARSTSVGGASNGYHDGRRLPTKWLANTTYAIGDVIRSSGGSGQDGNNRFFVCQVAGTSHASTEPTWPNSAGGTVTDNTVTWVEASQLYTGLVTGPGGSNTYAAADTMASHSGWSEGTPYSDSIRQAFVPAAPSAGSMSNSASKAVFNINATATVAGCFLTDIQTKSGTAGLLYGVGNFTGGDRAVQSGDTLNITLTCSVS
jgi:hypothetical protein